MCVGGGGGGYGHNSKIHRKYKIWNLYATVTLSNYVNTITLQQHSCTQEKIPEINTVLQFKGNYLIKVYFVSTDVCVTCINKIIINMYYSFI